MLDKLRQLGWGEYEARAYVALVQSAPATGYRVAKESGVPVAKIYEALARLVERGAARLLPTEFVAASDTGNSERKSAQYVATPPEELLAGVRARQVQMLDELARDLAQLRRPTSDIQSAQWLRGITPILGRASALIAAARKSVSIAAATSWETGLRSVVEAAQNRRVRVERVILPANAIPRRETSTSDSLLLILVIDGTESLIAQQTAGGKESDAEAFVTSIPFLAQMSGDYIRLRRAVALVPDAVARLDRHDDWLDWEESKQRRLLQTSRPGSDAPASRVTPQ